MVSSYILENSTDGYKYLIPRVDSISPMQSTPSTVMSIPGSDPTSNQVMAIQGKEYRVSIDFVLVNGRELSGLTNADLSDGTANGIDQFTDEDTDGTADEVVTIEDQIKWLYEYIDSDSTGTQFKIHGDIYPTAKVCHLEELRVDWRENNVTEVPASISLKVGNVI